MSTAAVIAQLAEVGTVQVGTAALEVGPWIILGLGLATLTGRLLISRWRRRTGPLQPLEPEVIDDALPMLFTHKPYEGDRDA